ncbi:MAG: hypothetical protein ACYS22_19530 [Planctomycetota bacterium]
MSGKPQDCLTSRKEKAQPADGASFAFFGPEGVEERFRFLVSKEHGDLVSVVPNNDARFKKGLMAWRWEEAEGGEPTPYRTVKTTPRRIDLRREASSDA